MNLFIKRGAIHKGNNVVRAALNGMYSNKHDELITSVGAIGYYITGRFLENTVSKDRTIINGIRKELDELEKDNDIKIVCRNKDNYVISNDGLEVDTENGNFVIIEPWELRKIFECSNKPFCVFTFFCQLVATINNTTKEWHMSQDKMVEFFGGSKTTVNEYLRQLEEMKLIYVYRPKKRRTDGTFQNVNNSYGRYADKEKVIAEALDYVDTVECESYAYNLDRRSIKQRYNAFVNGSKKYIDSPKLVAQLYKECIKYNKSLKVNPIEETNEDGHYVHKGKLDLSIFPMYVPEDDEWGESNPMEKDYSMEDIVDMAMEEETKSNIASCWETNTDEEIEEETKTVYDVCFGKPLEEYSDTDIIDIDSIYEEEYIPGWDNDDTWNLY